MVLAVEGAVQETLLVLAGESTVQDEDHVLPGGERAVQETLVVLAGEGAVQDGDDVLPRSERAVDEGDAWWRRPGVVPSRTCGELGRCDQFLFLLLLPGL